MFIRLTNGTEAVYGRGLIINISQIITIIEDGPDDNRYAVITGIDNNAWKVKESFDEVHALIEKAQNR